MAPEAGLLTLDIVINSQNAFYNLFRMGLSQCDGGIGHRWGKGRFSSCGNRDGSFDNSGGYLNYAPVGDRSSSSNVVGQLATILTSDRISPSNRALIESAYSANYDAGGNETALQIAQVLLTTTPEFHTTNKVAPIENVRAPTPRSESDENTPYKGEPIVCPTSSSR